MPEQEATLEDNQRYATIMKIPFAGAQCFEIPIPRSLERFETCFILRHTLLSACFRHGSDQ